MPQDLRVLLARFCIMHLFIISYVPAFQSGGAVCH